MMLIARGNTGPPPFRDRVWCLTYCGVARLRESSSLTRNAEPKVEPKERSKAKAKALISGNESGASAVEPRPAEVSTMTAVNVLPAVPGRSGATTLSPAERDFLAGAVER